jgi:long-chain acyl-CoA synthetase
MTTATATPIVALPLTPLAPYERQTLCQIFYGGVDRFGPQAALRWKSGGAWLSLTYREVEQAVSRTAALLKGWGLEMGDRIAILAESRPEWPIADYAALGLGLIVVPVYPTLPADQIEFILRDAGVKVVFASTVVQLEKLDAIRERLPALRRIVLMDPAPEVTWVERMDRKEDPDPAWVRDLRRGALRLAPDSAATIIYTSGTTGVPKGVMLTHGNLAAMIAASAQHGALPLRPGMVALSLLPLSHVLERASDYYYWDNGVTIAYAESVAKVPENLLEVRPEAMVAVPRLFDKVYSKVMGTPGLKGKLARWAAAVGGEALDHRIAGTTPPLGLRLKAAIADLLVFRKIRHKLGGRMETMICGGAPLSPVVGRFFLAAGLQLYEGYGLTETSPVLAANRPSDWRLGSVGLPYPGVELRIGAEGEIQARGPTVMQGYWNNTEATRAAIDPDGWFHTGDVGEVDQRGFLRVTDRIKDLIVTAGGKKVAPQPIEGRTQLSPYVAQAIMVGDRRPFPAMLIVPDFEQLRAWAVEHGLAVSDRTQLLAHITIRELLERETLGRLTDLAQFERPKKIAVLTEDLTVDGGLLTPTLKVRRRMAEKRFSEAIEGLYREPAGVE